MTETEHTTTTSSTAAREVRLRGPAPIAIRLTLNVLSRVAPEAAGRIAFDLWRRPGPSGPVHASERAVERGYRPVSYDAFGHGETGGAAGTILDHQFVVEGLAERHGAFEGVIAHSLGVPFALYAVREGVGVGRVVAISGVSDFGYLVDSFCAKLGLRTSLNQRLRRRIERSFFDGDNGIWERFSARRAAGCDLLVVHNTVDPVVDRGQADLLAAAYGDRATLIETSGLGHSRILGDPEVIRAAVAFLAAEAVAA